MGNVLCQTREVSEPSKEEVRVASIVQSYKPDHVLQFEDGKIKAKVVRSNTCPGDEQEKIKKDFKEDLEDLEAKEKERKRLLSSLRPSYTLDIEKKERVMI